MPDPLWAGRCSSFSAELTGRRGFTEPQAVLPPKVRESPRVDAVPTSGIGLEEGALECRPCTMPAKILKYCVELTTPATIHRTHAAVHSYRPAEIEPSPFGDDWDRRH